MTISKRSGQNKVFFLTLFTFIGIVLAARKDELYRLMMEVQTAEQQGSPVSVEVWQRILKLQPRMAQANVQVGFSLIESGAHQREGIVLLTKAISPKDVDEPFPLDTLPGRVLASTIARWHIEMAEVYAALPILEAVSNIKQNPTDLCLAAMSATLLHVTPDSIQTADKSIARYLDLTQRLIQKLDRAPEWRLDEQLLSSAFPGAAADPFVHCMNSLFSLSFYYRADVAQVANRHYQIASRIWPKLNYVTKKSKRWMTSGKQKSHKKRIHIGIASGCISLKHSVSEDFKGTFSRLDREKFHITYIFIKERQNDLIDPFVYQHTVDTVMILEKTNSDFADGAWITRYHPIIESLDLDFILPRPYNELTCYEVGIRQACPSASYQPRTPYDQWYTKNNNGLLYFMGIR